MEKLCNENAEEGDTLILAASAPLKEADIAKLPVFKEKKLKFGGTSDKFRGGIMLVNDVCDKDLSFKALLDNKKDELEAEIAAALAHVDWRGVAVDTSDPEAPTITLADARAALDLGGIAKGFIADRLVETLRAKTKATAAVISLGGNIICYGDKPDGGSWDIGIRDPNDPGGSTVMGTAHVHATSTPDTSAGAVSLVTSGLYERTFELDGVTYWHILDPQTGMPVETDVESVTVCCPSSTQADALSTALFVAGSERGITLVDSYENTAAYFILADGSTRESARWQELTD